MQFHRDEKTEKLKAITFDCKTPLKMSTFQETPKIEETRKPVVKHQSKKWPIETCTQFLSFNVA